MIWTVEGYAKSRYDAVEVKNGLNFGLAVPMESKLHRNRGTRCTAEWSFWVFVFCGLYIV